MHFEQQLRHIKSHVGSKPVLILSVKSLQVNLPAEEAALLESSPFMSHCRAQNAVGREEGENGHRAEA